MLNNSSTQSTSKSSYPLHNMIKDKQHDMLKWLLSPQNPLSQSYRAQINSYNDEGLTPLHLTLQHDDVVSFDILIQNGARIDVCNREEQNPKTVLTYAARLGRKEVLQYIIKNKDKYGFDLDMHSNERATALQTCVTIDHITSVKILAQGGAKVGYVGGVSAIRYAITAESLQIVKVLTSYATYEEMNEKNSKGYTYLELADAVIKRFTDNNPIQDDKYQAKLRELKEIREIVQKTMTKSKPAENILPDKLFTNAGTVIPKASVSYTDIKKAHLMPRSENTSSIIVR